MKINRTSLLKTLQVASIGITKREILEQSHSFIFDDDGLVTFNGEILTHVENPVPDVVGAVPAEDLLAVLAKFPDEEVDIDLTESEFVVTGRKRSAGIIMAPEVHLPFRDVPSPIRWSPLAPDFQTNLLQAARICGKDEAQPRTTEVHITPSCIEACDNFRLFRCTMETGVDDDILVPAASVLNLSEVQFKEFAVDEGWIHFLTASGHMVSVRCAVGVYPKLDPLFVLTDPKKIELPTNLGEIISRVEIMQDYNAMVHVSITNGELTLQSRKESGWIRESRKVDYSKTPLKFEVNSAFLAEILERTRNVKIGGNKLLIRSGNITFIVCLEVTND